MLLTKSGLMLVKVPWKDSKSQFQLHILCSKKGAREPHLEPRSVY